MSGRDSIPADDRPRWIVVGLGNVGAKYEGSRHNIGFDALDSLALRVGLKFRPSPGDYFVASSLTADADKPSIFSRLFRTRKTRRSGGSSALDESPVPPVVLIKPTTFMNRSGKAVEQALERYELTPERLLIVCDDFNLPLGAVRIRSGGSDGGHNGLRSIIETLGSDQFPRLRIGIGPKPIDTPVVPFVLGRFTGAEIELKQHAVRHIITALEYLLRETSDNPLALAASKYNISGPDPAPGSGGTGK